MNKQEAIKKLESIKVIGNDAIAACYNESINVGITLMKKIDEPQITDEQAWNKIAESYPESAQSLRNTLDNVVFGKAGEPQKPVVPKFVADWFEENKDDLDNAIFGYLVFWEERDTDSVLYQWFAKSENNPIETLVRMKDGYEVEKEPLYEVIIGDLYLIKKFNNRNDFCFDTSCSLCAWEKSAYQLTESEIKAIDERYWPFAVPVEEVAEE
ncbi:DUF1642 domain-containing protein [Enterococcus faecium]|uniref:DUF1642 domain-containing protein n=1 Tax=Enterococcus faecium TaxID=1352 RepID=UPI001BDD1C6E|nr:DUF1642 domain-containing protein [Enterococcus faecium]MCU2053074.1 DUF1642 domain-containing protein [Enterococcus faecium]QVX08035.1 DUF1642 domain-containing protein [Enterococcus faecium]